MRWEFRARMGRVREALQALGYRSGNPHGWYRNDWHRGRLHVVVRERKPGQISLHIHVDPPFHVGRVRTRGEDLERAFKEIMEEIRGAHVPAG